ncbi:MAG: fused MFS/spermidine synthase [Proteobacteria bacterium]|nr:fused MFS/spermidine synthase [Pseudomonadota bacterium]
MSDTPALRSIYAVFFASGVASLMCEVAWFKQLGLSLGGNTVTASVVIACFFGGLATGSLLVGSRSDKWARPLRMYGLLELALGVVSFGTTQLLAAWPSWVGWFRPFMSLDSATALPVKVLLALGAMLPATILMGATLPILARYLVRAKTDLAEKIGFLYGLNTLGAAVGAAAMGLVLIGSFGVLTAASMASLLYIAIGVVALWLARDEAVLPVEAAGAVDAEPSAADRQAMTLLAVFAASGFLALGYEVLWFRLLMYSAANTVYSFSTMLSTYLLGLVAGSFACARWLAPHKDKLLANFARVQLGIAVAALVSLGVASQSKVILHYLGYSPLRAGGMVPLVITTLLVLLPPTTLIGLSFPLASELTVQRLSRLGSRVALLYALNTYGGVLGSLVAGFVLLPLLGAQSAFTLLALGNLALFAVLYATQNELRSVPGLRREAGLTAATCLVILLAYGPGYLRESQSRYDGEVLVYKETDDATFVVLKYEDEHAGTFQSVVVNGTSYANNRPEGRRYMSLLAHLPMLLMPEPEETVVICVGTGTTIGAASIHDRKKRVWAVDITRHIFGFAPYFVPVNHSFHTNPAVEMVASDGRHFLQVSDTRFDVLTFEPPPPVEAGVVNLYSQEFYELADARLDSDAVVAQWIPFHQGFEEIHRMLIRTMMEVYPHVSLWVPGNYEGIIIGSHHPLQIDHEALRLRMEEADVKEDLRKVGVESVDDLLATFISADEDLAAFVGDAAVVTDDRPRVEHFLRYENKPFRMAQPLAHRTPLESVLTAPHPDAEAMGQSQKVMELLWAARDFTMQDDDKSALPLLIEARRLAPTNTFVQFRLAAVQRAVDRE